MLNKNKQRELAYVVKVNDIKPIPGKDRVECAVINGWECMVPKGQFTPNSLGVYFEIDSKLDFNKPEFSFTEKYNGKIKTQKFSLKDADGNKVGVFYSQGLLMAFSDLGLNSDDYNEGDFLTEKLGVTHIEDENKCRSKKENPNAKYQRVMNRHPKLARSKFGKWCMRYDWTKKILYILLGGKKDNVSTEFPVGKFQGVNKTDQERCENMTWILNDKTPFIVTQKCDGSSATYILERKGRNKFEFYVCSRNVRMFSKEQDSYFGSHNYYWEVAEKYDIENKMKNWLNNVPGRDWVCWQGEICAPGIQKNPHNLSETHFYCFHWTDSVNGRRDIRDAIKDWKYYNMETVPVVCEDYIMPDDFEEFKKSADGYYVEEVCEGHTNCKREGFVYYKTTDPTFSFKNVSREYLGKH